MEIRLRRTRELTCALVALISLCAAGLVGTPRAAASSPAFVIIINPEITETTATREFVARAFLKKTTRWPDGQVIHPVDQSGESALRRRFTDAVLDRSVSAVRTYWQQQIFSGDDIPPPEVSGDDAVVAFVIREPGAIGYVSSSANVRTAKVLSLR